MALLVNDITPSVQYTATASQTTFAYPFAIFEDADLRVYQVSSSGTPDDTTDILTLTTHYTVTGAGDTSGGNVVLVTGATVGDVITIKRDLAVKRTTDYQNLGDLASESFNDDLDKLVMMVQQNEEAFSRSISLQESTQTPTTFGIDDPVAEFYAVAKADLSGIKWLQLLSAGELSVSAFMQTVLDDTTAAEALTTLGGANLTAVNTFTKTQIWAKGTDLNDDDVDGSNILTIGSDGNVFDFAGTQDVDAIVTVGVGVTFKLIHTSIRQLTNHATNLILPGGANITTAVGDISEWLEYATGDFRCTNYSGPKLTSGTTVATTSGTSLDFTEIPSWAKRITINLSEVSFSGASNPLFQIGDAGGIEATGYLGSSSVLSGSVASANSVVGFQLNIANAANVLNGALTLTLLDATTFTWIMDGKVGLSNSATIVVVAGRKSLSAALDRVRITTAGGSDTFDSGSINILYE